MFDPLLQNIRKHIPLSESEADLIASFLQVRKIRKNQLLVEPPYPSSAEHFISKGCFRSYYLDNDGIEHTLSFAIEGWWMTDLQSFFTGEPAKYHVESLEEGQVFMLKKEHLEELYLKIPVLNIYFRKLYQNAIVSQTERLLNVLSTTADERYIRFIAKYPALEKRLPQYLIASYLGVTPEFLSKIKSRIIAKR
jgi:CRP-like cAMP-binding protein